MKFVDYIFIVSLIVSGPVYGAYYFTGDTVSAAIKVAGSPITPTAQDNTVDNVSPLNPINSVNGAYFNNNRVSVGLPYSSVLESTPFTGASNMSAYMVATSQGVESLSLSAYLSGLAWAQNPGNPGYITGVTYTGTQPGGTGSLLSVVTAFSPHSITLAGSASLAAPSGTKGQFNFDVTVAQPVLSLPSMVGNSVGATYTVGVSTTNRFNGLTSPQLATVVGNSATAEFHANATTFIVPPANNVLNPSVDANLDSNIIDLVFSDSGAACAACAINNLTLTFTNVLSASAIAAGYQITGISLLAGNLYAGQTWNYSISGGDVTLTFSGGTSTASTGQIVEALFQINGIQVPEPSTYAVLALLLVAATTLLYRRSALTGQ